MKLPAMAARGTARDYDLAGRVVLITGAAQGIGLSLARHLSALGAAVALVDINRAQVYRAADELGESALGITADVREREEMTGAINAAVAHFGRLDVVVANAGITPMPATVRSMDGNEFDRVLAVNLTGTFNTVKPALDHVIEACGHIVLVSSGAAFTPGPGGSPYMVSKAAVEQLGRALRLELASHEVTVQIAYLGIVETAMTHDMLDADDLGKRIGGMLPWPLNRRITAVRAAESIAKGIRRRASTSIAPAGWSVYSLLRGAANPILDHMLASNTEVHRLVSDIESVGR